MIRVDASNWTADFRLARALAEGFDSSGFDDLAFICVGDPDHPIGRLGVMVADETVKYYPNVVGTSEDPLTPEKIAKKGREILAAWPDKFLVAIEAGFGSADFLGAIEITDRGLTTPGPDGQPLGQVGDMTVNAVLRPGEVHLDLRAESRLMRQAEQEVGSDDRDAYGRKKFKPLDPNKIDANVVRKVSDVIIDGNLRLLARIGKQPI